MQGRHKRQDRQDRKKFKMSDLYEVRKIEGKGYGCFALKDIKKGTVILQELQKYVAKPAGEEEHIPETQDKCREFALNILSAFDKMSQSEKDGYLKLWNKFDGKQPQTQSMSDNLKFYWQFVQNTVVEMERVKKSMTIIGIHLTNHTGKGILIKMSQFNHSCKSNSYGEKIAPASGRLTAYKNIKAGQEITSSRYGAFGSFFYMLNRTKRQGELHRRYHILCNCDHCLVDDTDSATNYEKLHELILEEEILREDLDRARKHSYYEFKFKNTSTMEPHPEDLFNINRIYPLKKCRKHLEIIHLLFKHGREKKADPYYLSELVEIGFNSAFLGFLLTSDHRSYKQSFRNEALQFCKISVKFGKLLPKQLVDTEKWKRRVERLEQPICYPKI